MELTPEELNSLLLLSFLITLTYAISDEIHQTYVISRDGSFRDIFVDSIGMLTMVFFIKQAFAKVEVSKLANVSEFFIML